MSQRSKGAFSMIEVLIALALLVVVAMISMPMFASRMDEARAEGATSQVQVALSQARSEAQESGLPIRVVAVVNEDGKTNIRAEAVEHGSAEGSALGPASSSGAVFGIGAARGPSVADGGSVRGGTGAGLMPGGFGGASQGGFRDGVSGGAAGSRTGETRSDGWSIGQEERGVSRSTRSISLPTGFMIASDERVEQMFDQAPRSMGGMPAPSWASTKPEVTEARTLVIFLPDGTAISSGPIKVRNRAGLGGELVVNPLTGVAVLADARSAAGARSGNTSAGGDDAELTDPFR